MTSTEARASNMTAARDEADAIAALDALVLGEQRVVSHRILSSHLSLPTTKSKAALCEYAKLHCSDVAVSWMVTLPGPRVGLARGQYPGPSSVDGEAVLSCSVWAVASKGLVDGETGLGWVAADRVREFEMVKAPKEDVNELRVDKWSALRSDSSGWNSGGRASADNSKTREPSKPLGGSIARSAAANIAKKEGQKNTGEAKVPKQVLNTSKSKSSGSSRVNSLVERIKAEDAARQKERMERKKAAAENRGGMDKFSSAKANSTVKGRKPSSSVSRLTKPRGDAKAKSAASRKTRRVVDTDDDEDAEAECDDEEDQNQKAFAREEEEAEEAARERVALELDANDDDDEEQEKSEEVPGRGMDVDGDEGPDNAHLSGKRGAAPSPTPNQPAKRIKKTVEVTETDAKGYIVTKRVDKYFDEQGNEVPDHDPASNQTSGGNGANEVNETGAASPSVDSASGMGSLPGLKPKGKPKPSKSENASGSKSKSSSKGTGGVAKKGKRRNGNIASFFSK